MFKIIIKINFEKMDIFLKSFSENLGAVTVYNDNGHNLKRSFVFKNFTISKVS